MGKSQRDKGGRGERAVVKLFKAHGYPAKRATQSAGGDLYTDVEGTPFWVEVKNQKMPNIRAALKQAIDTTDGRPPVAFTHADRDKMGWLVTMRAEDWLQVLQKFHDVELITRYMEYDPFEGKLYSVKPDGERVVTHTTQRKA